MTTRNLTWALAGALLASMALNVAQGWRALDARGASRAAGLPSPSGLDLSQRQIDLLTDCCESFCEERSELTRELTRAEEELRAALAAPRIDRERVTAWAERLGELRARCLRNTVDSVSLVREVLTPEQVRALAQCAEDACIVDPRNSDH